MGYDLGKLIYDKCHKIPIFGEGENFNNKRNVSIKMFAGINSTLNLKVVELDNYKFNYTCHLDRTYFSRIKLEQSLEIYFEELQSQLLDLFHYVETEKMFLKLEANSNSCNMVFFEHSKLKTIVFLTIQLSITDQAEVISEIATSLCKFKDANRNLSMQLESVRSEIIEKDNLLTSALKANKTLEQQFEKSMGSIEKLLVSNTANFERAMTEKMLTLSRKHIKLLNDVEIIKAENKLKCESSVRLLNSMQNLRLENERNIKTIENLKMEINHLNIMRKNSEESCENKRENLLKMENFNKALQSEIENLKKDLENATFIISQKTKTHEEISKDLVQANTMLVNFNNQCDILCKNVDEKLEIINKKDAIINDQSMHLKRFAEEFNKYKQEHNAEEVKVLRHEVHSLRKTIQELEKNNREATKMNELLTRRLSSRLLPT